VGILVLVSTVPVHPYIILTTQFPTRLICKPTARPPLWSMPNQFCQEVHLVLHGPPLEVVFFIRANRKHEDDLKVLGIVTFIIHTRDPLRRHRATLWGIETVLGRQSVDAPPIPNDAICQHYGIVLVAFVISIKQSFRVIMLRELDKPRRRDFVSVVLDIRLFGWTRKLEWLSIAIPILCRSSDLQAVE
jgi:hypothetical protein